MSETQSSPVPRVRPRQVTLVAIMMGVFGALGLISSLILWGLLADESGPGWLYLLVAAQVVISAAQIVSGVLIWQGVAWARTLAAVICGLNIAGGVVNVVTGAALQAILGIVINAALIRALYHDDVTEWLN